MKSTNRIIAVILTIGVLFFVYNYMLNIIAYVLVAWVLSMMGNPIMKFFLERMRFNRIKIGTGLSAILVIIIFLILFSLFFIIILPPVINQFDKLAHLDYNLVFTPLQKPIQQMTDKLVELNLIDPQDLDSHRVKEFFLTMFNVEGISKVFSSLINVAGNIVIAIFSIGFITFFFLKEKSMFSNFITSAMPEKYTEKIVAIIDEISYLLRRYFGGIALQILILMLFVFTALSLFSIKDALIIAFFAAIINVIPYIGPLIGASFGIFIVLTNNLGLDFYDVILNKMFIVVIVFALMQSLDNYVLQPFIYSDKIKAHPLEIFIVILLGANIYGIVGMVLAIPTYIVLRAIAKVFFSNYRAIEMLTRK